MIVRTTVGKVTLRTRLDDGLDLERIACPIGVLLIIFEARPEVIANITALAIKSGNAAILKGHTHSIYQPQIATKVIATPGGKESTESFTAISRVISKALESTQVPQDSIQLVTTRDVVRDLLALDRYIDLVIPRGSNDLVRYVQNNTRIPVLGHADGLCSIYLHAEADPDTAVKIIMDAKLGYPAACNSIETLLVDEAVLSTVLPPVAKALTSKEVQLRCDEASFSALKRSLPDEFHRLLQEATEADYDTEFLDLILAIKTIPSPSSSKSSTANDTDSSTVGVEQAIEHINTHSSHHTDAIITTNAVIAERFLKGVDSAGVYWNTSTRMADGLRYGFGTEVGISTNKIHARGPVGLEGLMIYKYVIKGQGQVAGEYHDGPGGKKWKHEKLSI